MMTGYWWTSVRRRRTSLKLELQKAMPSDVTQRRPRHGTWLRQFPSAELCKKNEAWARGYLRWGGDLPPYQ